MYGTIGLAAAFVTTIALLGAGASDSLMENLDREYREAGGEQIRTSYGQREVVEGHTTFATIDIGEKQVVPREHRPTHKELKCEETNPTDPVWPIFESCEATVGPIEGVGPVPSVEEVHAEVEVANTGLPVVGNPDNGFWDTLFGLIPGL